MTKNAWENAEIPLRELWETPERPLRGPWDWETPKRQHGYWVKNGQTHGQTDSHTDRATSWAPVGAKSKLENVTEVYWNLTEPEWSVKSEHFMAKILAEKSHGSKFDPQILTIWTSTLHCSGDCDFMVTIVTMDLHGPPFRPNSVKSLLSIMKTINIPNCSGSLAIITICVSILMLGVHCNME